MKEVLSIFKWHACFEFLHQRNMICSSQLRCNTNDKNTNIGSDFVLFLCYESMDILSLNSVYSSAELLSMIILKKNMSSRWKVFQAFPDMIFHSYLLSFLENTFTLSPSAYHIFHKYKYCYWRTLSPYNTWKNLAMFWFSCTWAALMLTNIALHVFFPPLVFSLGHCPGWTVINELSHLSDRVLTRHS